MIHDKLEFHDESFLRTRRLFGKEGGMLTLEVYDNLTPKRIERLTRLQMKILEEENKAREDALKKK